MSIIKPEELKKVAGLPESAKFHGWLIHNPEQDDFLLQYKETDAILNKIWTGLPDQAMNFNLYSEALCTIEFLELKNRAIIVVAFDLGNQVIVIAPDDFKGRMSLPSSNPFRTDSTKH
ncbi:hypothetical protein [Vibrio crassostreae]|uniref:hypothetical protein n=1 Tax=Vibrio crassostreae TaxID=246167 RepID=UPI000635B86A|nr:hypothetical protein [Vibrio crassostreae]CAK1875941.1 conserved hypothetical protein [Vibrio crassostreae]CAK1876451.1 conserved hypothetical protein [Vibrio crassostreae]CAK1889091.1 conserved hypothetical protein [Vibrio crassostreae]CAK1889592.1 conserved hypothetical protein [Vibrio crassostreae]CAK2090362.1 conserved hypothetical protein [Vibrio crassostreae]